MPKGIENPAVINAYENNKDVLNHLDELYSAVKNEKAWKFKAKVGALSTLAVVLAPTLVGSVVVLGLIGHMVSERKKQKECVAAAAIGAVSRFEATHAAVAQPELVDFVKRAFELKRVATAGETMLYESNERLFMSCAGAAVADRNLFEIYDSLVALPRRTFDEMRENHGSREKLQNRELVILRDRISPAVK
jgi:hypothetical protein